MKKPMNFNFFGELMIRLTPEGDGDRLVDSDTLRVTLGGSEANSAVALTSLGRHNATFISALPDTPLGKKCLQTLKGLGVNVINLSSHSDRMGLYWLDMGAGPRASKVYYDRADSAFDKIISESIGLEHISCDWFHSSGITPGVSRGTCAALFRCIDLLPQHVPFSMDLNFRSKLWQWADEKERQTVYDTLARRAVLLAGNESDFQTCLGITATGDTAEELYSSVADTVFSRYPTVRFLSVSLRESHSATLNIWSGMFFVRTGTGFDLFAGPRIEIDSIIDRLGTGDSFTAGILHGIASFGDDFQQTVNFAVMLSALKHTVYGDFCSFTEEEIFEVLETGGTGIIQR